MAILASRQTTAGIGLDAVPIQFHESLHCNTLFVLMCSLCNLRFYPCHCAMKLPLVTMIRYLAGYGLAGDLPDFSDLSSLQTM